MVLKTAKAPLLVIASFVLMGVADPCLADEERNRGIGQIVRDFVADVFRPNEAPAPPRAPAPDTAKRGGGAPKPSLDTAELKRSTDDIAEKISTSARSKKSSTATAENYRAYARKLAMLLGNLSEEDKKRVFSEK